MRGIWIPLLGASLVFPGADSLTLRKRDTPAVVALDTRRQDIEDPVGRDLLRRRNGRTISQGLDNKV